MADYQYHIFLSYRRMHPDTIRWTKECFQRPLEAVLSQSINGLKIFRDDLNIGAGTSWPDALAHAHAHSRIIVPVLCPTYFDSDWCRLELALMRERENLLGFRTAGNQRRLIFPVIINDGDRFPKEVSEIQGLKLHEHSNPDIQPNTERQARLTEVIRVWAEELVDTLLNPPECDPAWLALDHQKFRDTYLKPTAVQPTLPRLANLILPP